MLAPITTKHPWIIPTRYNQSKLDQKFTRMFLLSLKFTEKTGRIWHHTFYYQGWHRKCGPHDSLPGCYQYSARRVKMIRYLYRIFFHLGTTNTNFKVSKSRSMEWNWISVTSSFYQPRNQEIVRISSKRMFLLPGFWHGNAQPQKMHPNGVFSLESSGICRY